ncbi:MAG: 23S rRNA (uridine(2552)-2'-O)-methyltransferase [Halobacteria archaeon]|nr:23S rRNA (uridine(2552)-2'-O)-methyltransferase [Halobacteria archaeon]
MNGPDSKDEYYNRAKQEGYRARSAYKLKQIDDEVNIFSPGDTVVDLGAAPGGWLQVASERVGNGDVLGVDLQYIDELDAENVETLQGDITEGETRAEIVECVGEADVVVSDASPDLTGTWNVDQARSVHLSRQALETAKEILRSGGNFVVKVFQGDMLADFREEVEAEFEYVRAYTPDASRDESSEIYLIGKGYLTAPVEEGDTLEVEIVDTGDEGDGIARVEDYVLIVKGADEGENVEVRVNEVRTNFGFAEVVE